MKISWNWLREFVMCKKDAEIVGNHLTLHTAELEEIIPREKFFSDVFLGKLESCKPHPQADKLHIGQFDFGKKGKKQIVFGATHKIEINEILPVALDGAILASGIKIENTEIRGFFSEGMICDNSELGLKMPGLLRFSDKNLLGTPLNEISAEFRDVLFDIDNKSLTHRPDLMGHRGFAREISVIFSENLVLPEPVVSLPRNGIPAIPVEIQTKNCRRFCALEIKNVSVSPSLLDTAVRLENLGIKSISNIVDITNWVMLDYGQPMHVYDADKVLGKLIVRPAKKGEKLLALDGNEYKLTEADLVIADEEKVLAIAGIIGGMESSVSASTKNILFESANFNPVSVRKTAQRLGIRTESSMRFEKSLDPEWNKRAILSAAEKTLELFPNAKISSTLIDVYPAPFPKLILDLNPTLVQKYAGIDIPNEKIESILKNLGFGIQKISEKYRVEVPSFRATKDISVPEDLVEEIIRMYGFERIKSSLPVLPIIPPKRNELRELEWTIRNFFSARSFLEIYNYSFVGADDQNFTEKEKSDYIEIENPLSEAYRFLRRNLISGAVRTLESELRKHKKLQFFELGNTFVPQGKVLPNEKLNLLLFMAETDGTENQQFFELKSHLALFLRSFKTISVEFLPLSSELVEKYQHPSKTAAILVENEVVGKISVLHPQMLPVKNAAVSFVELDLEALNAVICTKTLVYRKISPFPRVFRDLSVVIPEKVFFAKIEKTAFAASNYLRKIELFDEFSDEKKLGKGLKNLAFHLEFQAEEKTLSDTEIDESYRLVIEALKKEVGAKLRLDFDNEKQTLQPENK